MQGYSANKRVWDTNLPEPMRVLASVLRDCAHRIEAPAKARIRAMLLPLIRRKYGLAEAGTGLHWGRNSRVRGARFGNYASFGHSAEFNGPVVVGDLSMLSTFVQVVGHDHGAATVGLPTRIGFPRGLRPVTVIEADCWICSRVTLIEGVTIGRGSVVGAGAVVTQDLPPYSVAVGLPARVVRQRFDAAGCADHDRQLYGFEGELS